MAVMQHRPVLLFALLCLLAFGYLFTIYPRAPKVFHTYTIETTMTWSDGPNVKLDAERMKKLNAEVDGILDNETHGTVTHYPVISLDKKWVEVMYFGNGPLPENLQETLDAYIKKRLPALAREQVAAGP